MARLGGPPFAPTADTGHNGECDERQDAENEDPEADDLTGAVVLPRVALPVACRTTTSMTPTTTIVATQTQRERLMGREPKACPVIASIFG